MKKRTALITGGASGIGRKTVLELAEKGMDLVINYRSKEEEAITLSRYITEKYGTKNTIVAGDLSKKADCERVIAHAFQFSPTIDIFVHNVGPYIHERKRMVDYSADEWEYMVKGNLNSFFYLAKPIIEKMREQHWGRIVTVGFDRVETAPGWKFRSAFAAAKTGLASLTKTLALEEAENGITVNMVCPGDIIGKWKEKGIAEAAGVSDDSSPIGRPGTGEDIARVISFLLSEQSDFITGSIIHINGGKDVLGKYHNLDIR